ncbi:MAG: TrkH family potassium uptake protein [Eubacteriales bacterium]|nr:TrkH family potassium uptake protein [Eubacteriales bacterium]
MKTTLISTLKITGLILVAISIAMLPPVLVCMYYGEYDIAAGFGHAVWIDLLVGFAMYMLSKAWKVNLRVRDGYMILAVCWLAASIFGSFPYIYANAVQSPLDAFFESTSGFSTTGVSVFDDVEMLPHGLLLWRSITSWLGGLGILVFAVALMPALGVNGTSVAEADKPSVKLDVISPKTSRILLGLSVGYSMLTIIECLLLRVGGMGMFDSVIHSLGTVSTGGFSNYNDGIMHFSSVYIRVIIVIFMLIAGSNFTMFYSFTRRRLKAFTEDTEFKAYLLIMLVASCIIFVALYLIETGWSYAGEAANSAFQVVSMLTTTGYLSDDYTLWPVFCQMILILLMVIGGCSSSASSGNKVVRFVVVFKLIMRGIRTRLHSNVIHNLRINRKDIPNDTVSAVTNTMFLYLVTVFLGASVLALEQLPLVECFTTTISLVGNVGTCFGSMGLAGSFADLHAFTKIFLSFLMIAGRLEIYTILVLFTRGFWRSE